MLRVLFTALCSLMTLVCSDSAAKAACLECWRNMCNQTPSSCSIPSSCCDCVKSDTCDDVSVICLSGDGCCDKANEYLDQEIYPSLTPVSASGGKHSNHVANQSISRSVLPLKHVFVIDAIEFDCVGCMQSVSLYLNRSISDGANTNFILSVWRPHTSTPDNSTVFVSINSSWLKFDAQPVMSDDIYRAKSTVHDTLCFEPGDRLGVTIPLGFNGKILRQETSDGVAFMQPLSECQLLNEVLFEDSAQESGVPLIDVTIIPPGSQVTKPNCIGSFSSVAAQVSHTVNTNGGPITVQTVYFIAGAAMCIALIITCLIACLIILMCVNSKSEKATHSVANAQRSVNMIPVLPPLPDLVELNKTTYPTKVSTQLQKQPVSATRERLPITSSHQQQINWDQQLKETGQAHIYAELNMTSLESGRISLSSLHNPSKTSATTQLSSSNRVDIEINPVHNQFIINSSQQITKMSLNPAYHAVPGDSQQPLSNDNPTHSVVDRDHKETKDEEEDHYYI